MQDQNSQFLNPAQIIKQIDLEPGAQVGDLGCGTGYMSFAASSVIGEKGQIYAVDIQKPVLSQVQKEVQVEDIQIYAQFGLIWKCLEQQILQNTP